MPEPSISFLQNLALLYDCYIKFDLDLLINIIHFKCYSVVITIWVVWQVWTRGTDVLDAVLKEIIEEENKTLFKFVWAHYQYLDFITYFNNENCIWLLTTLVSFGYFHNRSFPEFASKVIFKTTDYLTDDQIDQARRLVKIITNDELKETINLLRDEINSVKLYTDQNPDSEPHLIKILNMKIMILIIDEVTAAPLDRY